MGCKPSIEEDEANAKDEQSPKPAEKPKTTSILQKKLNRADFICSKRTKEVVHKPPGSIAGQQFVIEDCDDCDIFICDNSDSITVDYCTNCRMFIGPVEGSFFVRNCKNLKVIVACGQFRTRDCENCEFLLFDRSQPIIETSSGMKFGCFSFPSYPELAAQVQAAKMNVFNNQWSLIYDFNKPTSENWSFLPSNVTHTHVFNTIPDYIHATGPSLVPITLGRASFDQKCLVLIFLDGVKVSEQAAIAFANSVAAAENMGIVQMKLVEGKGHEVQEALARSPADLARATAAPSVVGIEVSGLNCEERLRHIAKSVDLPQSALHISEGPENAAAEIGIFFDVNKAFRM